MNNGSINIDADLEGIISLARRHIQVCKLLLVEYSQNVKSAMYIFKIRNRSWMKRIHRDCFVGSDLVDFLLMQVCCMHSRR